MAGPVSANGAAQRAPRWGVSALDWRSHAVDETADHPPGVYVARCGHQLRGAATLYDEAPGWMCLSCPQICPACDTRRK